MALARRSADAVMNTRPVTPHRLGFLPESLKAAVGRSGRRLVGLALLLCGLGSLAALAGWNASDPSLSNATTGQVHNFLGRPGAMVADLLMQLFGLASLAIVLPVIFWGWRLMTHRAVRREKLSAAAWAFGILGATAALSALPRLGTWPTPSGLGGAIGDLFPRLVGLMRDGSPTPLDAVIIGAAGLVIGVLGLFFALAGSAARDDEDDTRDLLPLGAITHMILSWRARLFGAMRSRRKAQEGAGPAGFSAETPAAAPRRTGDGRIEPSLRPDGGRSAPAMDEADADDAPWPSGSGPDFADGQGEAPAAPAARRAKAPAPARRDAPAGRRSGYAFPSLELLTAPPPAKAPAMSPEALRDTAQLLEGTLQDFGVRGEIAEVRPGPVVTLYELEPAPGIKSSRVIGLADDIARSMSAISARVAVVPGKNAIGIELPNAKREKVLLRELLATKDFGDSGHKLAIALGKTIGGEPVIVDLARMPHLLVAGTTGSGKSVAINTMILSLLYRLKPEQCRLIMVDPKMLELSVYDGIPHLLAPVVTDPKKAVVALKWAVREMEDRYKKMSKLGVRNIDGFNARVREAAEKGETVQRTVQTGFDHETGEAVYESEELALAPLPYIVVVVDEMADLMLVAGKDIEGAIQRLAQMARAAGIHLVMATQRPSVDVITGTIKANFPTRISFQVTSKIDSRTILGEQGAEQLLGQGDMLYMAGGGRISRVHGPFVSDEEVEDVVKHLKAQGVPAYVEAVTADLDEDSGEADGAVFDKGAFGEEGQDLYSQAVAVVVRDKKCSTSYIQRRLQIGYNRAASLVERMEQEGVVSGPNHAGKREVLLADEAAE